MAIINSVFVGRAKKSAGNATFRTVRGRTIASQKVAKTGTRVGSLTLNQFALAVISRFASLKAADINVSFDPTTYGSPRNAFFKLNYNTMKEAVRQLWMNSLKQDAVKLPTDAEILDAITAYATANPSAIYRVKKAGMEVVYLTGEWTSEDNPEDVPSTDGKVSITISVSPDGAGTVTGAGRYVVGETVTLEATANSNYNFNEWSDGVSDNPREIVVPEGGASYTATFSQDFS